MDKGITDKGIILRIEDDYMNHRESPFEMELVFDLALRALDSVHKDTIDEMIAEIESLQPLNTEEKAMKSACLAAIHQYCDRKEES